jgi:fimbrial chaperone protein
VVMIVSGPAMASVVMLNTRVIYPADAKSQTLQFTNNDKIPYVLQLWADKNNPSSTPDTADAPFMVIPAMFRVEPTTGQSVRLVFTGQNLPQDRESIFYLNTVQIPPKNMAGQAENQMTVILRNRVKIFYRPKQIVGGPDQVSKQLHFKLKAVNGSWVLQASNDSGYYATVISAAVVSGKKEVAFIPNMIAPKSSAEWNLDKKGQAFAGADKVKFTLINDYGGKTTAEATLDK